jgi:SAM-dependent methyltransferase
VQAGWTRAIRLHLYARAGIKKARQVLEVGCGTGVLTAEISRETRARVNGLDLDRDFLALAHALDRKTRFVLGDGATLPYRTGAFDLVLCHFFLLWVKDPLEALREMKRVARRGRAVLALAEPDYGGRIDYPESLAELGRVQTEGLRRAGANPFIGRELASLFMQAGFINIETGVLGGEWRHPLPAWDQESEWAILQADLSGLVDPGRLEELQAIDQAASEHGERVLYVPTFYAIGWVG